MLGARSFRSRPDLPLIRALVAKLVFWLREHKLNGAANAVIVFRHFAILDALKTTYDVVRPRPT